MFSVPTDVPAADRARWLAEVADALEQAHRLLFELHLENDAASDALDLYVRIEGARLQVQALRSSRSITPRARPDPNWTNLPAWPVERAG
jgi:hypothetical protein